MHIAVVGYGTAGQAAAALLAQDGHKIEVFERAPVLGPVGAGLLLQPTGLWVLWQMGLLDQILRYGAPIRRLFGDTATGNRVMDMRYETLDPRMTGVGIQRGALFQTLRSAWAGSDGIHCDTEIIAVSDDGRRLTDERGAIHGPYDLLVLANGAASKLRDIVKPHRRDRPYAWGALWCLLPKGRWPHVSELRQRYQASKKMIGLLPVGSRPDDPTERLSFFWSLPIANIPQWQEAKLSDWQAEAASLWPEAKSLIVQIADGNSLMTANYRDAVLNRWHNASVVLLGDAAHAMSPQLGQGVNMALLDAMALRDALRSSESVEEGLQLYEGSRRGHAQIYQFWSRWLTPLFQSDRRVFAFLRDLTFMPIAKLPLTRGQMLRVLTGTQKGLFGRLLLPDEFLDALHAKTGRGSSSDMPFPLSLEAS